VQSFDDYCKFIYSEIDKFIPLAAKREAATDRIAAVQTYASKILIKEIPEPDRGHIIVSITKSDNPRKTFQATIYDDRNISGRKVRHREGAEYILKSMDHETVTLVKQGREFQRTLATFSRFFDFIAE